MQGSAGAVTSMLTHRKMCRTYHSKWGSVKEHQPKTQPELNQTTEVKKSKNSDETAECYYDLSTGGRGMAMLQIQEDTSRPQGQDISSQYNYCGLPRWLRWWRICLQCRRPGFNLWVRKIPWRREWLPTSVFFPGEFHGRAWRTVVHEITKSRTQLSD